MKYVYIFIVLMFGEYVFAQSGVIAHRGFWKTDGSAQNSIAALLKADSVVMDRNSIYALRKTISGW